MVRSCVRIIKRYVMSTHDENKSEHDPSRRTLIKGVGLGAVATMFSQAAGAVSFSASAAASKGWDREADVVVVGSGAGGFSAALFA